jgi:hypothetical protein
MKKPMNYLVVGMIAITAFSCKKHENQQTQGYKEAYLVNEKDVKSVPPASLVLIPGATRPRIGFVADGADPFGATSYGNFLLDGIFNSSGVLTREIVNPNQFLGLPSDVGGIVFTGLAVDRAPNYYDPSIILCRSRSSEHALFFASLNAASNYAINSYLIVSASFAPSSTGWELSFIESHGSIMYGVFYNQTAQTSKIAQISKTTGTATLIKTFAGAKFEGMDFSTYAGTPDKMYLKSGAQLGTTTCAIYVLDLINTANSSVIPTNIPTSYSYNSFSPGSFLVYSPDSNGSYPLKIYDPLAYAVYNYSPTTYLKTTYCTGKTQMTLMTPPTLGSTQNFGGQAMNDAAR